MKLIDRLSLANDQCRSKLAFTTTGGSNWPIWDRFLSLDGEPLFHIGNICGTCEFFFRRLVDDAVPSFEIDHIRSSLQAGIPKITDVALTFCNVIPNGQYTAALFEAHPKRAGVEGVPDYFTREQRLAWKDYDEGARPERCDYFRESPVQKSAEEILVEFFIPLYDISLVNRDRVEFYKDQLRAGIRPTAVSLSVLDVKTSVSYPEDEHGNEIEPDFRTHWCFANYLLDGHHKVVAAQETGLPITLLAFISHDHSWQRVEELIAEYEGD